LTRPMLSTKVAARSTTLNEEKGERGSRARRRREEGKVRVILYSRLTEKREIVPRGGKCDT